MRTLQKIKYRILRTFQKEPVPPSYELKRDILNGFREKYRLKTFVETGTFFGDTVEYFKNSFEKVISIELAEDLAKKAQERFAGDANVAILQGDSGQILKQILPGIREPVLFWLDGHYSSEFFVGEQLIKTARTDKDTPIEEELNTILASPLKHVILIDDARGFTGVGDYPSVGSIQRKVRKAKGSAYQCKVENDIIRIYPEIAG